MGINKSGKPRKHNAFTQARIHRAVCMLREGKTLEEIGSSVEVSKEAVRHWINSAIEMKIMSREEYEDLKNRGLGNKRQMYFSELVSTLDYLNRDYWIALKKAYGLTKHQASDAERKGIAGLSGDGKAVSDILCRIEKYGVTRSNLERLAENNSRMDSGARIVNYLINRFNAHKASIRKLCAMAHDYLKTTANLSEIARNYLPSFCRQNPSADARQQLLYAVELGMLKHSDFLRKGQESMKAAWAENGKRQSNYFRAH